MDDLPQSPRAPVWSMAVGIAILLVFSVLACMGGTQMIRDMGFR